MRNFNNHSKMKNIKQNIKIIFPALAVGIILGWLFFGVSKSQDDHAGHDHDKEVSETTYTCSMHPQIRQDEPGQCPICAMDLIPVDEAEQSSQTVSPDAIKMSEAAMKIADIQTMKVRRDYSDKIVHLLGRVKPDEREIAELTARFGGRIEKLFVNFKGERVKMGEPLASIYSPELVTAQKELLEAVEYKDSNPAIYKATRNKLKLWDLSEEQIDAIIEEGDVQHYFMVRAPVSGTVTRRNVSKGDYIEKGNALFQIMDLTKLWLMFEAYESDLPWLSEGDKVEFTVQSLPGKSFSGLISHIDPFIDPETRIARVRVEVDNHNRKLKPEMFANGMVKPKVDNREKELLIPRTAVLWTGKKAVVYIKQEDVEEPTFLYREIVLGPQAGDFYIVEEGLDEGEEIAVNGVFKIDAAAQLAGKQSMMNPAGEKSTRDHHHGSGQGKADVNMAHVEQAFVDQLDVVYQRYLLMNDAFVASDPEKVTVEAREVKEALGQVDMSLVKGDAHELWMEQAETLKNSLNKMIEKDELEEKRKAFSMFNLAFYKMVKSFRLNEDKVYYQYCPMAFDDEGAYWFSDQKDIRNPYFGDQMLKCGETRETFEFE